MSVSKIALFACLGFALARSSQDAPDKYRWLEDVHSERSMAWVRAHDERTGKALKTDPKYAAFRDAALTVLQAPQRLPEPELNGDDIYNFWRDHEHVDGILRRTSVSNYLTNNPSWQTVLDYDALSKREGQKWVAQERVCLYPGNELCMVQVSAGGEDASTMREFNLKSGKFVGNGFTLPRSKQTVAWIDRDTLLVARDWGPGTMTSSGYPFVVKVWKRGTPLNQASEVYRGVATDMGVEPLVLQDAEGSKLPLIVRGLDFFHSEYRLLTATGVKRLALPAKTFLAGLVKGQLIATVNEDWTLPRSTTKISQGSVFAADVQMLQRNPMQITAKPVFTPSSVEFSQDVQLTKSHILISTLNNVQGRVYVYTPASNGAWACRKLNVPDNQTVRIVTTNWADERFFLATEGFLTPPSLLIGDAAANTLRPAKSVPAQFDASSDMVEQLSAVSKDGTRVPYFILRPKQMKHDGSNPTLLSAYGGFQISVTPSYDPVKGKLWLEKGGVFVLANIRGGGEFGPAWHEAGLKTHRQRIYDDFAAVERALIATGITSPQHLGIEGGSNGGLLMGVEMTQHPELSKAVVIRVPLLDMLGYEHIAAGASWIAEFGSVSVPDERAFLASISPYNQLKPNVKYPEPLILTTTKDDRVGPQHARKFAAKMEEFREPFFFEEIVEGGHGNGADLKEQAGTEALVFTYLNRKLMGSSAN